MNTYVITFNCKSSDEQMTVADHLHWFLSGKQEYINNDIVLHIGEDDNTVKLYVDKNANFISITEE